MVSITSEYTPARLRTMAVALIFAGFPLCGVASGLAAAALVPALGWTSLFYVGGIAPLLLLLLPLLWWLLPESAQFLALRGDNIALNRITARLDFSGAGPLGSSDAVATDDHGIPPAAARTLVARLFGEGRAPGTLLLWTALFLSLLATYLLVNWIPIIAGESATTAGTATFGLVALNLGAVVGAFAIGRLADRFHRTYVVGAAFLVGALAISAMGWSDSTGTLLPVAVFATGISPSARRWPPWVSPPASTRRPCARPASAGRWPSDGSARSWARPSAAYSSPSRSLGRSCSAWLP
jgi:AAHS family 4-hydroxybenzoate transporter-like MFS transporter